MPQDYIAISRLVKIIAEDSASWFGIILQLLRVMEEPYLTTIFSTTSLINQVNNV